MILMRIATAFGCVALALTLVLANVAPSAAQVARTDAFGRVLAYTAPTESASGSITIGTRTFTLAPGSATPASSVNPPPQVTLGSDVWFSGERNAAGALTTFSVKPMTSICGIVTAFTPSTATSRGSITIGQTAPVTLPVAAGLTLSQAQVTGNQCFTLAVDAQGDGQVVAHVGPPQGGPAGTTPAAAASPTPGTPRELPSTSTQPGFGAVFAVVATAALATGALGLRRRRSRVR